MAFNFCILTADTNQAKSFSIVNGELHKSSIANATRGYFTAHSVSSLTDFVAVLNTITIKQSLIMGGVVRADGTVLAEGEKIALTIKEKPKDNAVARSKDFIKNLKRPGFMLFDIDARTETYKDLQSIIPQLNGIGAVTKPSSSSMIFDSNGVELVGPKGRHIFIPVLDMSDIERAAIAIWGRQWLSGHGEYIISRGVHPMLLERGIYDRTVLGYSERLAFEAPPILHDGLRQLHNHCVVTDGGILDTRTIPDLSESEIAEINAIKNTAKQLIRPEYNKQVAAKKSAYISTGKTESDYSLLCKRELPPNFDLFTTQGIIKAGDLKKKHDLITMADPFEPDYDGGSTTKAKFFWNDGNPIINSQAHGGIVYKINIPAIEGDLCPAADWQEEYKNLVDRMNKTHWQVIVGGKYRVMRRLPAKYSPTGRDSYEFFSKETMDGIYTNTMIQTGWNSQGLPVFASHYWAWAKHKKSNVYRGGLFFKPSVIKEPDDGYYFNTWNGYAVEPIENSELLERIKFHIEIIMCGSDQDQIDYFYNWIAYTFQNPDKPAGSACVVRGVEGAGKGVIGHFIGSIWGSHGSHISSAKHLTGSFNGHLTDTCFLFADEAFYSGDKAGENRLKALITEPSITIERKGVDAISMPNCLKIFMATNHDYAVPATKNVRRFFVIDISSEKKGDKQYFDNLVSDCKNQDVKSAFLYEMLNRDLKGYHPGKIPDTAGLKDQRLHTLCSAGKWLADSFSQGFFSLHPMHVRVYVGNQSAWLQEVSASDLKDSYILWCDENKIGEFGRKTTTMLGRYLSDIGYTKRHSGCTIRVFGTLENAICLLETYEKIKINLPSVPKK